MSAAARPARAIVVDVALGYVAAPLALLVAWELLSRRSAAAAYALVPLADVGRAFVEVVGNGELPHALLGTLRGCLTGLALGGLAGVAFGSALGLSRIADRVLGPLYHGARQVPLLGLAPLLGLWLGTGSAARLAVVALASFYPVALATADGLRSVDRAHLELARSLVLGRRQTFRKVLLPTAVPWIVTGFLQALGFTWIATVGSELLFSASGGLGGLMQQAQTAGRMEVVLVGVGTIAVLGLGLNAIVRRAGDRLERWRRPR